MSDANTFISTAAPMKRVIKVKKVLQAEKPKAERPKKAKKPAEDPEICMICMDPYNKSTKSRVECQHCHTPACRNCLQTYLLDAGMVPLCMVPECRLPWSDEFIETNTSTTWRLKDLKKAREQFIHDIQKARLPDTLPDAENVKLAQRYLQNVQEVIVKPLKAQLEAHWYTVQKKALEAEDKPHSEEYFNKNLQLHTVVGCEKYEEYKAWVAKTRENAAKRWNLENALEKEEEEAKKKLLDEAAKTLKEATKVNTEIKKLYKTKPDADTLNCPAMKELKEKWAQLTDKASKLKLSAKRPSGTYKGLRNSITAATHDRACHLARRSVDSFGKMRFDPEGRAVSTTAPPEERRAFVRACPAPDCRGFLSTAWKCGLCETWVCPDCHEIKKEQKDDTHSCKPETIETAKMLAKEAKPCPKCAAQICKIDGCDQMWCTQCHTAFSWKTGKAVSDGEWVHNPHYYEWARRNGVTVGRTPGDAGRAGVDPCGGFVQWGTLVTAGVRPVLRINYTIATVDDTWKHYTQTLNPHERRTIVAGDLACLVLEKIHQQISDMRWRYNRRPEILTEDDIHHDLRVKYLIGEITEEELKVALQRKDKAKRKTKADWDIHNMFITAANDVFQLLLAGMQQPVARTSNMWNALKSLIELREYTNKILMANEKVYHNLFHVILDPLFASPSSPYYIWWKRLMEDKKTKPDVPLEDLGRDGYLLTILPDA